LPDILSSPPDKALSNSEWVSLQLDGFRKASPRYKSMASVLQAIFETASKTYAPLSILQTRPKTAPSFAEKALRKRAKYQDPLLRMTDLCGARVITQTQEEVVAFSKFVETHFLVDQANSLDVATRLQPSEFGYRSVHYIVQFKRGVFPTPEIPVDIPEELYPAEDCPMKAEIQIRTMVEHAWAGFAHDRAYKSAFSLPAKWQRELAILAGMLESVDESFSKIQAGLQTYSASYGAYMTEEQMRSEADILEAVRGCDSGNYRIAHRIGKLYMTLGEWTKAEAIFSQYLDSGFPPILRDLGIALCKIHAADPSGEEYRKGQQYLEKASAPPYRDSEALASLAGTYKNMDAEKTRALYRQAYEIDPSDPYAVGQFAIHEIAHQRDLTPVSLMMPAITAAMQRCRDQAAVGMNLPWAYFDLGLFYLLLGSPYEGITAYAKAIALSAKEWPLATCLSALARISCVRDTLAGYEWARRLLLLGRAVKFNSKTAMEELKSLVTKPYEAFSGPVILLAGGCDAETGAAIRNQETVLRDGFQDFSGTIVSGGTAAGICGVAGDLQEHYPGTIRSVGYVPRAVSESSQIDKRYSRIRATPGESFSLGEPLQAWIDIWASGIPVSQVKLLGIDGGMIAAAEYRVALALGAAVGILETAGGEGAKLLQDKDWQETGQLLPLPADAMTIRAFIGPGKPLPDSDVRDTIARAIHKNYVQEQTHHPQAQDPALVEWDQLLDNLKDSNRRQADHIHEKLRRIGCSLNPKKGSGGDLFPFSPEEVEILAEMEHGRWVVERLRSGWKWSAQRDVARKTSPYLVAWKQLPEQVKEWDRVTVRKIPQFLSEVGLEIVRNT
jgi:ppGpp synthetase/RelA/SpoT-type nucleotidyltranferase